MEIEEILRIYLAQCQENLREYRDEIKFVDKLRHYQELKILERRISASLETLENKLKRLYSMETGLRASGDLWKRLPYKNKKKSRNKKNG